MVAAETKTFIPPEAASAATSSVSIDDGKAPCADCGHRDYLTTTAAGRLCGICQDDYAITEED
jgi:hypothetical protein